jgi:hypothetical protein
VGGWSLDASGVRSVGVLFYFLFVLILFLFVLKVWVSLDASGVHSFVL